MLESELKKLEYFIQLENWKGYDPYDALNSPFLKFLTFGSKPLRLVIQQSLRRSVVNLRPLFGVPKGINPKGMGLFALGYLNRFKKTGDLDYKNKAVEVLNWLQNNHSSGYSGYCWGYNFDWQSRAFFLPAGTPTVVNTSFIGRAFVKAYEILAEKQYLDVSRSACDFILNDLNRLEVNNTICLSYSPLDRYFVHNANALGASLLAQVYAITKEEGLFNTAKKMMQYVCMYQKENGAWLYGEDEVARKTGIDNFHTGFVLESLKIYALATGDHSFDDNIERGLKFYQENFFLPDGAPTYFYNRVYPLDIHSACQAIITLIRLKDYGADMDLCHKVVQWMIKNMWDEKKGYFYYQKGRFLTNKIPYIRWSQAWAFYALTFYNLLNH